MEQLVNIESLLNHYHGDKDLILELLVVFEETYKSTLLNIEKAIEEKDFASLEIHAHTLKGMVSNFFVDSIEQRALILESIGKEKTKLHEKVESFLDEIKILTPQMISEIKVIADLKNGVN